MATAKVILNPYAGRWLAKAKQDDAEKALRDVGIDYELDITAAPQHATQIAAKAVEDGFAPIIVAGGDGSISEVVNGMLQATGDGTLPPLGILPLGSANDLVLNLSLPVELDRAAAIIASGKTKHIDLGQVSYGNPPFVRFFDNNSAIGLEPTVTLIQQRITRLRGILRYMVATISGIMSNPHWTVDLEWDDGEYHGPSTLVTVGNCPLTGGLYMAPHADPYDGKLTFVHGYMQTRRQMLALLPKTMKPGPGSYVEHPAIHEIHTTKLSIHANPVTPLHADGEIQSQAVQDISYSILPGRLPVLLP